MIKSAPYYFYPWSYRIHTSILKTILIVSLVISNVYSGKGVITFQYCLYKLSILLISFDHNYCITVYIKTLQVLLIFIVETGMIIYRNTFYIIIFMRESGGVEVRGSGHPPLRDNWSSLNLHNKNIEQRPSPPPIPREQKLDSLMKLSTITALLLNKGK